MILSGEDQIIPILSCCPDCQSPMKAAEEPFQGDKNGLAIVIPTICTKCRYSNLIEIIFDTKPGVKPFRNGMLL